MKKLVCLVSILLLFYLLSGCKSTEKAINQTKNAYSEVCNGVTVLAWQRQIQGGDAETTQKFASALTAAVEADAKKLKDVSASGNANINATAEIAKIINQNVSQGSDVSKDFWEKEVVFAESMCSFLALLDRKDLTQEQRKGILYDIQTLINANFDYVVKKIESKLSPEIIKFPPEATYLKSEIEEVFIEFSNYMKKYLKSLPLTLPPLQIEFSNDCNGSFYIENNRFILHNIYLASDHNLLRRIHMHYFLYMENPVKTVPLYEHRKSVSQDKSRNKGGVAAAIESAIADYFACSIDSNPVIGGIGYPKCIKEKEKKDINYLRTLDNKYKIFDIPFEGGDYISLGEAWGGLFWDIRNLFTDKDNANDLIMRFWNKLWTEEKNYKEWTNDFCFYTLYDQRMLDVETKLKIDSLYKMRR